MNLPEIVKNTSSESDSEICYEKGKFLGKGGFAKCFEFWQISGQKLYAGKIVPKSLLVDDFIKVSTCPWSAEP